MQLDTINKLYLELSQVATARTARELEMEAKLQLADEVYARMLQLEDLLRSARAIAERRGENTAWETFDNRVASFGIGNVTPKVFKVPVEDSEGAACDV